jgi:tetratricopeptide (TPR) repeat protein
MAARRLPARVAKFLLSLSVLVGMPLAIELGFRLAVPSREFSDRLPDPLPPKRAGELRIFAYGESIPWGAPQPAVGFVEQLRYALATIYPERYVSMVNYSIIGGPTSETAAVVAGTISQSPDIVIVMTGGNEGGGSVLATPLRRIRETSTAVRTMTDWRGLRRITRWFTFPDQSVAFWPDQLAPYDRADLTARVDRLKDMLARILGLAQASGAQVLLCTEPSNLRDWAPVHLKLARADTDGGAAAYERAMREIETLVANGSYEEAQERIERVRSIYHDDAMLLYLEGRIRYAMREYGPARDLFVRAKETDPLAWRMLNAFNDAIRESAKRPGVRLVDVDHLFMERAPGGSPGLDLVADNAHPTPYGGVIIAEALVKEIRALEPSGARDGSCCNVEDFLKAKNFRGSATEVAYLLRLGRYTMKTPWYRYSISRAYLNEALAIAPSNWEIWANLATLSLFEGELQRGREELDKATDLKGSPIDPGDREKTPYLVEALHAASVK